MSKQQATLSKLRLTLSKQHSTLLPQTATMSNDSIVKFRPFDKVDCCFDIVERIVQLVAFDNVAWILLLAWTGLKLHVVIGKLTVCRFIVLRTKASVSDETVSSYADNIDYLRQRRSVVSLIRQR